MSDPTTAAIQAIRDRLDQNVKGEEQLGRTYMDDYDLDPFTRTDAMRSLGQAFEDDAASTYGDLARSAGVEDTAEFRKAIDTRFDTEWANRDDCSYDRGDDPGRESDLDQRSYTPAEWYGDAQQAADDEGIYWWDNTTENASSDEDVQ